jgi:hypothetical protein
MSEYKSLIFILLLVERLKLHLRKSISFHVFSVKYLNVGRCFATQK